METKSIAPQTDLKFYPQEGRKLASIDRITIIRPDDFHLHLREGYELSYILRHTTAHFARAIVMPNLTQAVLTGSDVRVYKADIHSLLNLSDMFTPLMTVQITESTTPEMIEEAFYAGAVAGKVYPRGMTTNSENGVMDYLKLWPVFQQMEELGMLLLLHGEHPESSFCLDRERDFLDILREIHQAFRKLKIVMEHVTTEAAVGTILRLGSTVAATITVHHLFLTLDDVVGGKLKPHNFCKPLAKRMQDREALIQMAISANPKFFLGTDSAPHAKYKKECEEGCAGVFTAPIAMPLLVEFFEKHDALDRLERFTSVNGADFYGLPQNSGTLTLVKKPMTIPKHYQCGPLAPDVVVPFKAGHEISWSVVE